LINLDFKNKTIFTGQFRQQIRHVCPNLKRNQNPAFSASLCACVWTYGTGSYNYIRSDQSNPCIEKFHHLTIPKEKKDTRPVVSKESPAAILSQQSVPQNSGKAGLSIIKDSFKMEKPTEQVPQGNLSLLIRTFARASFTVKYILIGAGAASFSALESIKEVDPNADVLIIGDEAFIPYMKPPLSKELWRADETAKPFTFKDWHGDEKRCDPSTAIN
jgi:hypothetical protein